MYIGIDTAARISADAAKILKREGVSFVGRYVVEESYSSKALTAAEAAGLREAGLAILLCWETSAERAGKGAAAGAEDGARARRRAAELGVPDRTAIFFAVDYCPAEGEYGAIEAYLRAAGAACAPYVCGVYGSYYVVEQMARRGACEKFWQCVAWSNGRVSDRRHAYQYLWSGGAESLAMQAKVGFPVDMNKCEELRPAGLWLPDDTFPHWYDEAMAWAEAAGLIRDGRPEDPVTRAELATVLRRFDERMQAKRPEDTKTVSGLLADD